MGVRAGEDRVTLIAGGAISAGILLIWEILGDSYGTVRLLLSSPLRTCSYVAAHFGEFAASFVYTGLESVVGLLVAQLSRWRLVPCASICRVWAVSAFPCSWRHR